MSGDRFRRITVNLSQNLLEEAMGVSGKGLTETLIQGLEMLPRKGAYVLAQELRGKLVLDIELNESRERPTS